MASNNQGVGTINREVPEVKSEDLQELLKAYVLKGKPGSDDEKWQEAKREIAVRNIFLLNELRQILEACNRAKIEVIVLKGAALTENLYPHLGLRTFSDLDLLFHREDMPRVAEIMRQQGYQTINGNDLAQPWTDKFGWMVELLYIKQKELTIVADAHWGLGSPGTYFDRIEIKGLWQRARKQKVAEVEALILSPEDLLIYLCLHLFKHLPIVPLNPVCDIAELIKRDGNKIDWEAFLERVFQYEISLPVRFALQQACEVFQCPVPDHVLQKLNQYQPGFWESLSFRIGKTPNQKYSTGRYTLSCLLVVKGFARKLGYIRRIFFPDRKFMLWRYGKIFNSLPQYYIMHLLRVLREFGVAICPRKGSYEK